MPLRLSKKFVERILCNCRCAIGIWDTKAFNKSYMARAVPLGLSKRLSKEVYVIVAVPLGLSKEIAKRSLCNSRCAIGIRDAENFEKGYMAHAVPLVFDANFLLKSTNISLCAMSRLDLVTFRFSVGCRYAIGIVTKWCDFPPCDVTFLHLAITLGDVTFLRVMWLKPGVSRWLHKFTEFRKSWFKKNWNCQCYVPFEGDGRVVSLLVH